MTEQERVDKLKARMSRWQAYVDRPQANTQQTADAAETQQTADAAETQAESHQGRTVRKSETPPVYLPEAARGTKPGRTAPQADAPSPDPLNDMQEARIADLKTVIAREREQADRLAEEVVRAQRLHAATLYSHLADEQVRNAEPHSMQWQSPETPHIPYEEARQRHLVRVLGISLVITSVLVAAFFLTR